MKMESNGRSGCIRVISIIGCKVQCLQTHTHTISILYIKWEIVHCHSVGLRVGFFLHVYHFLSTKWFNEAMNWINFRSFYLISLSYRFYFHSPFILALSSCFVEMRVAYIWQATALPTSKIQMLSCSMRISSIAQASRNIK